jgi:hypothetical protein
MAERILKKSIEMMCLDDPGKINFFTKSVVYNMNAYFFWSKCNLNMNILFII